MQQRLQGIKVALLGGDLRQKILAEELVKAGAEVKVIGLPGLEGVQGVTIGKTIVETIEDSSTIILPMPGVNNQGQVFSPLADSPLYFTEETLESLSPNTLILVGIAGNYLPDLLAESGHKLLEIAELDDLAILNSIPSAEGALQLAMEQTDITIHGSESFVLGYGRCGVTMARMLWALGAKTTVFARSSKDLARIYEQGLVGSNYDSLPELISKADIIFNTVPAMLLPADVLAKAKKTAVVIDIASSPGGTDFSAAQELGLKAILAPGLPGKVAPRTAGQILSQVIPPLILEHLALDSSV